MNEVPLIELMERRADPETTRVYLDALIVHHWLWRWLGISDPGTLSTTRRILFDCGLVEANPDAAWVVDRGRNEYATQLPGMEEDLTRLPFEALDGHRDPADPFVWMDSGAGNGTALYELSSSPWLRGHGTGLSLLYSIDGTLRNWLREPHRSEFLPAYRSELLRDTLLHAEIFSAAAFAAGRAHTPDYDPFAHLSQCRDAEGRYDAQALGAVATDTVAAVDALRSHTGEDVTAAVGLGFVLDALAGRSIHPNAPGFHYERWELSPQALDVVVEALAQHARLVGVEPRPLQAEHEAIVALAQRHASEPTLSPDQDTAWSARLAEHADALKAVAFAIRRSTKDDRSTSLLHNVGNALWSWHFFLEDRRRWNGSAKREHLAVEAIDHVRSWLERPWGLLTTNDVTICLGGSPSDDKLPPLAGPVIPLFTGGYDALRHSLRNPYLATEAALLDLVQRRCRLRDLRSPRADVLYPRTREMAFAELLVDLVSLWFHELPPARRSGVVAAALTPLRDALVTGDWWPELKPSPQLPQLSRRQHVLLDSYLASPRSATESLFEFTTNDDLVDRIDVYPPESFNVISSS